MWDKLKNWFNPQFVPLKVDDFKIYNTQGEVILHVVIDYEDTSKSKVLVNKLD